MKYYETLGVDRNATPQEIIKAYRKICRCNWTENGITQGKFEEIEKAYEVLSNPKKRDLYDNYGEEGLKEFTDDFDLFSERKFKEKTIILKITLEDSYNGGKKEIEYDRIIICPICNGAGSLNPSDKPKCFQCNGGRK